MANPFKGEAVATLGDGRKLTLVRDFNALAEAEEAAGVRMDQITAALQAGGPALKYTRALLWGALREHHPEISLKEAGELLMNEGDAISAAMAKVTAGGEARPAGGANPRKAGALPRGTGTRSSRPGAKKA